MKKKTTTKKTAKKKPAETPSAKKAAKKPQPKTSAPNLANRTAYYSMGIDAHKAFSQVHILTPEGEVYWKGRINRPDYELFLDLVQGMDAPCKAVFESAMNWHVLYDFLSEIEGLEEVKMAHPLKVKLICDAQLKNDKVDAMHLAQLLRLDMIPEAHACSAEARATKELVRQRAAWVGMRTKIKNRTHRLLGGMPSGVVELPKCSDLFGRKGMTAMRKLELPEPFGTHLRQNLDEHEHLGLQIKELEKKLKDLCKNDPAIKLLSSIPGVGIVIACVIGAEVDGIERFTSKKKFIAYCGLAPRTSGSAGVFYQGKMLQACNKWLKWAFIEAAWVSVGCDGSFGELYQRHRRRGKMANTSITIVARRMAQISYEMLSEGREYERKLATSPSPDQNKTFPARSSHGLVGQAV